MTVFKGPADLQIIGVGALAFAQNDVDGASNSPRACLSRWRTHDFDFLHHLGCQGLYGKARRHTLPVQKDLGITTA